MNEQFFEQDRRDAAIHAEGSSHDRVALAEVWHELTTGQTRIIDGFITEERCYLRLTLPLGRVRGAALSGRRLSILQGLLCGQSIKALAYDLSLSPSTVSYEGKAALRQLGMEGTPCKANPLLAMLARAEADEQLDRCARIACYSEADGMFRVIGAPRPDARLAPVLSPAEFAVVRGLLEGRNYLEIARNRGTSTRTVANQLAAAFRRLGVSGRGSLLNHVVCSGEAFA
jgi:DNA-binding NarL/FixJ family response regulator